jgi:ABC-type Zn2+ transport system substrate-binding protein/surface adhesin
MEAENAFAGQGPVMLDIGGDIGALVVHMPAGLDGVEIEIRPAGDESRGGHDHFGDAHGDGHHHAPHSHADGHDHSHADHPHPHVAVVARPTVHGTLSTAVFPELTAGRYELYERLDGTVRLSADIVGGEVTEASWPG